MNTNPLGNRFHAPLPTWTPQPTGYATPSGAAHGNRLFDDTTEFYSWYVTSWYLSGSESTFSESSQKSDAVRKILSLIKRIAEVSMNGGYFLSEAEESKAVDGLSDIMQDLNSGKLRKQDLPEALLKLMFEMTESNPKAKVVAQTTELEYRLCINPSAEQSPALTQQYQEALSRIIHRINPKLLDINASAISQGLSQILENLEAIEDFNSAIHEAVRHWL